MSGLSQEGFNRGVNAAKVRGKRVVESRYGSFGCSVVGEVLWGNVGKDRGHCDNSAFVKLFHGREEGFDCVEMGEEVRADGPAHGITLSVIEQLSNRIFIGKTTLS